MNRNAWIIFAVVCVALIGGLIFISRQNQVNVGNVETQSVLAASEASGNIADHTIGNKESKVILLEYGDFQCPSCKSAHPNLKTLSEEFKDKIVFVFRNNPLTNMHPNARAAAAAAEAAGLQGKYWEMHDKLFDTQTNWTNATAEQRTGVFEGYAKEVGVANMDKFREDVKSENVNAKINYDLSLGRKDGVTGTPTIFLKGEKIEGGTWGNIDKFRTAIQDALK